MESSLDFWDKKRSRSDEGKIVTSRYFTKGCHEMKLGVVL